MKFITVLPGCVAAALTLVACNDNSTPGGPDFGRDLAPGEYQVSVTGDVQRSFESTGATYQEFATPPSDFDRAFLSIWDNTDALNGADFYLCVMAVEGASYRFDAATPFTACPADPGRAWGGFIVQLGAPQADELDCYPNSYGDKAFEGVLIIASVKPAMSRERPTAPEPAAVIRIVRLSRCNRLLSPSAYAFGR